MTMKCICLEKFYLIMKISSQVSHLYHFIMVLSNHNLIILQENIYLPSMRFLYRKSLFKNVSD